jgi:hypothetical protein
MPEETLTEIAKQFILETYGTRESLGDDYYHETLGNTILAMKYYRDHENTKRTTPNGTNHAGA